MNRGARHAPVFLDDEACSEFLAIVAELPERFALKIHGYALMPNHFHLLLETPRANLSRAMQYLSGEFVRRANARRSWDGPIFKGRFRNRVVETDAYWRDLLCYLHLNPIRAHLVNRLEDTRWTSHEAYMGTTLAPEWLTTADMLGLFGGVKGYFGAITEFLQGRRKLADEVNPTALWKPATSATTFVPAKQPAPDVAEELERVAKVCGVPVAAVTVGKRGRGDHRARWVAAWWLVYGLGMTNRAAADALNAQDTMVCRWVARVRSATVSAEITAWMAEIQASATRQP